MKKSCLIAVTILSLTLASCVSNEKPVEHSPESTLADLEVFDGLNVTLFAAEPMLTNPTNIDIDAKGRVWVCEAYNYRSQLNPKNPVKEEGDRILILEDTDGDGKADTQKVFYQGSEINAALGVCVLGNKVIVSCSPNVFVFTDEDGDDVPDKKEILFKGIQGEQHDHGMHSFTFGHDGKLYFTMGNEGKTLLSAQGDTVIDKHGYKVVTDGTPFREGMVLRCDQDGTNVEVVAHNFRNNYEATIDPFGGIWQSDNDDDGNKGTRINFVMEFGNYGYKDEMTGAGWRARRTNMEKEIPLQHWHLNDPGVVPNLLQTGSGSPAGITMYEGTLLPEQFQGCMIHAEPGHNAVRAYPVKKVGAGYSASIVDILKGQQDQWFRPVDVSVAPDGSLFIADWYDPGVGGHQAGDQERGRIYRVAPKNAHYKITPPVVSSPADAVKALVSPNAASRFIAWKSLLSSGLSAEEALLKVWRSSNQRQRAQALWLLARLQGKEDQYMEEAIRDSNDDIRIAGLRAARQEKPDILPWVEKLVDDPSAQVRREAAVALRGNQTTKAAELWATLATHYDGDRWYLEALGIGAVDNWDLCFDAWKRKVGDNWMTSHNPDIVWRTRSDKALPLMADLVRTADEQEMLRYYRSFDFHTAPYKHAVLANLALDVKGEKAMFALKHLNAAYIKITPALTSKLNETLAAYEGKIEYVELTNSFDLRKKAPALLDLALAQPDSMAGKEAMRTLIRWERFDLIDNALMRNEHDKVQALIKVLQPQMYDKHVMNIMEGIMYDTARQASLRKAAVRAFGGHGQAEERLLQLARENKIPAELSIAAVGVFQSIWRKDMRDEAAKYLQLPSTSGGAALPDVAELAAKTGDGAKGKEVFKEACSTCHQVKGEGVNFGPGLTEIGDKLSREGLYRAILFPDQGISFGYEGYTFKMKDGSEAFGMILSETESEVEIKYMSNTQILNKNEIVSRRQIDNSLMPANLQAGMSEEQLVDLVEYLGQLKKEN